MLQYIQEWLLDAEIKLNATLPHEDPVILCTEIEDKTKKLEREIFYLVNKVKNYKPKKPKASNATNTTTSSTNKTDTTEEEAGETVLDSKEEAGETVLDSKEEAGETVLDSKEESETKAKAETGGDEEKDKPTSEEKGRW